MKRFKRTKAAPSRFNEQAAPSEIPVDIQFRHMPESKRVGWLVEQMMERFDKYPLHDARVQVVVDETHHRSKKPVFQVKTKLWIPGERLYVAKSAERIGEHDGVYVAISKVFEMIERQLGKRHGKGIRHRCQPMYAQVA